MRKAQRRAADLQFLCAETFTKQFAEDECLWLRRESNKDVVLFFLHCQDPSGSAQHQRFPAKDGKNKNNEWGEGLSADNWSSQRWRQWKEMKRGCVGERLWRRSAIKTLPVFSHIVQFTRDKLRISRWNIEIEFDGWIHHISAVFSVEKLNPWLRGCSLQSHRTVTLCAAQREELDSWGQQRLTEISAQRNISTLCIESCSDSSTFRFSTDVGVKMSHKLQIDGYVYVKVPFASALLLSNRTTKQLLALRELFD